MSLQSLTPEQFNQRGAANLPGHLGIVITVVNGREIKAELPIKPTLLAPNGYLHAGSVVTLADTAAGYGCIAHLPEGAVGFTTIELKSNHLGTALEGTLKAPSTAPPPPRTWAARRRSGTRS